MDDDGWLMMMDNGQWWVVMEGNEWQWRMEKDDDDDDKKEATLMKVLSILIWFNTKLKLTMIFSLSRSTRVESSALFYIQDVKHI